MKNTSKPVRLVAILSFCFFVLELSTTIAMPVNEAKEDDRELRSALESFLQDTDNTVIPNAQPNQNGTNTSNDNNSTQNRVLSDELVDDSDLDASGSADETNENDEGDYFLKTKPDSTLPPLPLNSSSSSTAVKNLTNFRASPSPGPKNTSSESSRPVVALSGPVDNTDLSLEQPDLPNHENKVVKEGDDISPSNTNASLSKDGHDQTVSLSNTSQTADDLRNDSSINITNGVMEDEGLDLHQANDSDSFSSLAKVEDANTILQNNSSKGMASNTSDTEVTNKTATSEKKLLHFLDISENYTKGDHNVTNKMKSENATNSSISKIQDTMLATMKNSTSPTLRTPGNEKQLSSETETKGEPKTTTSPRTASSSSPQPIQYLPEVPSQPTKNPVQGNYNPMNLFRNPYENYQTRQNGIVMSPNGDLDPKQAFYNRLYQNAQWQNGLQRLQPQGYQGYIGYQGYQRYPSYQYYQRQFQGRLGGGSYRNDGGLYQRSGIEYPNTLLDSNGNRPKVSQLFEDALFDPGQGNGANDVLAESTVKSLQPSLMSPAYGQDTRFYTNGQNSLLNGGPGAQPLGGQQGSMSKKQAYNVYQAAIYLADLLKNESIKLDEMASGQHRNSENDDDLFGGESDKGSGENIAVDQPESPVHSTLLSDKQVDKLIQAEDLGENGISDSETSGKSPNYVPNFDKSSSKSLEEPEIYTPSEKSKNDDDSNMENEAQIAVDEPETAADNAPKQSVKIAPVQETKPAVQGKVNAVAADSTAAVQPQVVTDAGSVASAVPQTQAPTDTVAQLPQTFDDALQPAAPVSTDSAAAIQQQAPVDTSAQQTQSFIADNTAQPGAVNTVPDQSQSYSQPVAQVQPEAQPAVSAYSAAAADATQQTFNDATLSTQQADYQGNTVSAFNQQQPAEATNNAAATQQWDTTAPQESQQYNDAAAAPLPQTAQTPAQTSYGKSHTIQLNEDRYRTLICKDGKDTISCPPGKQISVVNANYGSMGASACLGREAFSPSQYCKTPGASEIVKTNCDDMENCELMANDDLFGTECQTDKKYLDLEYDCVPGQSPSPYQAGFPQAMYPAQQPAASSYMYPGAQPQASSYQGYPSSPAQQGYGQQQQQLAPTPPPLKLPELMSRLVALSQKNQASSQQMCDSQCNTCNQCTAMPVCNPCPVCQSTACTATPSVPYIPKGLRPLWELWNERTADMSRMEMSALIISPVPKLPPTKKSSSLTEKSEGSGDENSDKRSNIKSSSKTSKKSLSKHSKNTKASKKSSKRASKAKHS